MLSAYVNDHHTDWDEHLPYVMMAYRSAENETTGLTPNMLMLGREATTPLDIVCEMPSSIKPIPVNHWVWELRERLESAQTYVRQYTGESISRQKSYHDMKLSFEVYEPDDMVYVLFPVKKVGCSIKFTAFWRGPFKILEKVSDVLYKVDLGRPEAYIIHCERLFRERKQVLTGEVESDGIIRDTLEEGDVLPGNDMSQVEDIADLDESQVDETESESVEDSTDKSSHRRIRRRPIWAKDYVFSAFRTGPNLKITPRKHPMPHLKDGEEENTIMCSICKDRFKRGDVYFDHVVTCSKFRLRCEHCGKKFKAQTYLVKHRNRFHANQTSGFSRRIRRKPTVSATVTPDDTCETPKNENKDPVDCCARQSTVRDDLGDDPNIELDYSLKSDLEVSEDSQSDKEEISGQSEESAAV